MRSLECRYINGLPQEIPVALFGHPHSHFDSFFETTLPA